MALASGTAALHLGLLELGAGPGTAVIVPSMTFAASANPVVYTGLRPGEKLSENLFSRHEDHRATTNPLITSVDVPTLHIAEVRSSELDNHKTAGVWMRQHPAMSHQQYAPSVKSGI